MPPVLTVIIPTYNYGRFLEESVCSALAQGGRDVEVVVVDDGSTDDTPAILHKLESDPRVVALRQERRGPGAARNAGLAQSCAPYVGMLDADDVWLPGKLERQLQVLETDTQIGLVFTNSLDIPAPTKPPQLHFDGISFHRPHVGWAFAHLAVNNYITTSTVVTRRSILEAVGCYDESLEVCEDWDLWLRIAARWKLAYVDAPLVRVRRHGANTHLRTGAMLRDSFRVLERAGEYGGGWQKVGARVRDRAYGRAHVRAAHSLYLTGEPMRALRHLGRAAAYDIGCFSREEVFLAARCVAIVSHLKRPRRSAGPAGEDGVG